MLQIERNVFIKTHLEFINEFNNMLKGYFLIFCICSYCQMQRPKTNTELIPLTSTVGPKPDIKHISEPQCCTGRHVLYFI